MNTELTRWQRFTLRWPRWYWDWRIRRLKRWAKRHDVPDPPPLDEILSRLICVLYPECKNPVRELPTPIPEDTEVMFSEMIVDRALYCQEHFDSGLTKETD